MAPAVALRRPSGPLAPTDRVRVFDTTLRDGEQAPGAGPHRGREARGRAPARAAQGRRHRGRLPGRLERRLRGGPADRAGDEGRHRRRGARALPRRRPAAGDRGDQGRRAAAPPRVHRDQRHPPQAQAPDRSRDGARRGGQVGRATGARQLGRDVEIEFSAEDASRTDPEFLLKVYEAVVEAGASTINIPDTVGYAIPSEFAALVGRVVALLGSQATISVHCHNDLGLATANTLAAVQAGARQVEVTINGLGERAGNASLEEVVMALRTRPDAVRRRRRRRGRRSPRRPDRAPHRRVAPRELPHRLRGPAEQGGRRRQRVRPRIGHPPGRRDQEPADLRDHDPAVGRAVRLVDHDRQAVRPEGPREPARRRSATSSRARRSTRSIARRWRSPTRRRTSPTTTSSRSSSSASPRCPQAVRLEGWNVTSSHGGKATGHGLARGRRRGARQGGDRQRPGRRAVRGRRRRARSRSSAGTRCSRRTRSRRCRAARTRRAACWSAAAAPRDDGPGRARRLRPRVKHEHHRGLDRGVPRRGQQAPRRDGRRRRRRSSASRTTELP